MNIGKNTEKTYEMVLLNLLCPSERADSDLDEHLTQEEPGGSHTSS